MENLNKKDSEKLAAQLIKEEELRPAGVDAVCALPPFMEKLRQYEKATGTSFAATPLDVRSAFVFRRIQQLTNIALLSAAWKEHLGTDKAPATWEEWQALPLCDKETATKMFTGERPGMVVPLSKGGFEIVASGGTGTGHPSETVYSLRELADTYKLAGDFIGQHMLKSYLTSPVKWLSTTLADYQMWSSGTMVGGVLQQVPGVNYIGAGPLSDSVFGQMMSYEGDKAIMGITQSIERLPQMGRALPASVRESLKVAMYGSGVLTSRQRKELTCAYPNVTILSYFAATQAEAIGLQLDGNSPWLTPVPGLHLIEIVDDQGRWVKEGETGELVITRLHANEAPVLRFKVGDRMTRRADMDKDGLKAMQFEFAGRSGEVLQIRDTQYPVASVFEAVCNELAKAGIPALAQNVFHYQFQNNRKTGSLVLLLEVDNPAYMYARTMYLTPYGGLPALLMRALIASLSIFNEMETKMAYLQKSGYYFNIRFVPKDSPELVRTEVGKIPLLKDII